MRVVIHRDATTELEAAADRYETRRPELGQEFMAEVRRAVALIADDPETWPVWSQARRPGVRRFLLSRFPHAVVYVVRGDHVLVVAIAHTSRHPRYWAQRLQPGAQ